MAILKKILIVLLVLVVGVLAYAATQPDEYQISRETRIDAPAAVVFAHVNDLRKFNEWNPWAHLDPQMKSNYEGPSEGVGATHSWDGNSDVGAGKMTIVESQPFTSVKLRLEFLRPMEGTADVDFLLVADGAQTDVTWNYSGKKNYLAKVMCLFMNMDKMMGSALENGLAKLKQIAEAE